MQGTVKVWVSPQSYAKLNENKIPDQYWMTRPSVESIELVLPIELVESWKQSKVNRKKVLYG